MNMNRFTQAMTMVVLFLGVVVFGPAPASAATEDNQQVVLLQHISLGGGSVFTSNYVFTSTGGATTVNVKCFNDSGNRIGPLAGVNIAFSAANQVSQQTPATLGVTADPLFTGTGWCWLNGTPTTANYNIQETHGVASDLTPGGILNAAGSTFVVHSPGAVEVDNNPATANLGGVPLWTTAGGAQHFLVLLNPLKVASTVFVRLFDTNGIAQGTSDLSRPLNPRSMVALTVPTSFGLASPPTTGSIKVTMNSAPPPSPAYMGWYLQVYPSGKAVFSQVGLQFNDVDRLHQADAP
jgi:hypothetical protein